MYFPPYCIDSGQIQTPMSNARNGEKMIRARQRARDFDRAIEIACSVCGISENHLGDRKLAGMDARRITLALLRFHYGYSNEEISGTAGLKFPDTERLLMDHVEKATLGGDTPGDQYLARYVEAVDLAEGRKGADL